MLEWVKGVERAGFIVEADKMLYKIRHPQTHGLIMTAPMYPRGNSVLKETIRKAKQRGIIVGASERRHAGGQPPPPVESEIPEDIRRRMEQEATNGQNEKAEEEMVAIATKRRSKRGPASREKIAATTVVREAVIEALEKMGGNTKANRIRLYELGVQSALREKRKIAAGDAEDRVKTAENALRRLIDSTTVALWGWVDDFWLGAVAEQERTTDQPMVTHRPPTLSTESLLRDVEELQDAIDRERKTVAHLRDEVAALENANSALKRDIEKMEKAEEDANGAAPISDELSVAVLRRMLLMAFPAEKSRIEDAINFATEVARRTST
jgi:hypothetical protein